MLSTRTFCTRSRKIFSWWLFAMPSAGFAYAPSRQLNTDAHR
ncbi:hypothetical protein [Nostoc sp.]